MSKIIIAANRLPVKVVKHKDGYDLKISEGGLATGLRSVYKNNDNVWIGWPGLEVEDVPAQYKIRQEMSKQNLLPVFLDANEIARFYEGFSNEVLWPVFHYYASTYAHYEQLNWECYFDVNQKFCDEILKIIKPGDVVWVHDYQLLLLPKMIRNVQPHVTIGFFLHIPFPSHEMFRIIPWRKELLEGMLGADLIGFHTFDDVRHFLSSVQRVLALQTSANVIHHAERSVVAESFPMGIDDKKFLELASSPGVKKECTAIRRTFSHQKLILSVDRLDYSKGILQRLMAFEQLLDDHPELLTYITLYMIVVPSRDQLPQYKELRDQIDKRVGNINSRYRTLEWSPVQYFYRPFPIETLSALYNAADVCLVTPMRDGMNLVSKEYVASRVHNDGVLILSEMAGASKELIDALIVNPNNISEVSDAIFAALNMPAAEQKRRMTSLQQNIRKFNIDHWVKLFRERLEEVKQMQRSMQTRHIQNGTRQSIINRYHKTKSRLLFLDYDGTLVEFKAHAKDAVPDGELTNLLGNLTSDLKNEVVMISGRKHDDLEKWFGHLNIHMVAEHGAWLKFKGKHWHKLGGMSNTWKTDIHPYLDTFVDRTPGTFIEEKTFSLAWHYRQAQAGLGEMRANELMNNLKYLVADKGLQLLPGNKVVEVKNVEINKGKAALTFSEAGDFDLIIALGDDNTDEDIFKSLPETAITIKVGSNISAAKFYLHNPLEVRSLLLAFVG